MASKTIELSFSEFKTIETTLDSRSRQHDTNNTVADANNNKKSFDFDGLVIELVGPSKKSEETSQPKPAPVVVSFRDNFVDVKTGGDTKSCQKPEKPKVLELDLDQLPGTSKKSKIQDEKVQIKEKKIQKTVEIVENLEGAAGLWMNEGFNEDNLEMSKIDPPPVTEEDWEIFKQFMDPPEPCYNKLVELGQQDTLVVNQEEFVCAICESFILKTEGVVLKNCLHNLCRLCLVDTIYTKHNEMGEVKCPFPYGKCEFMIEDFEVKALLGEDFNDFADKILKELEIKLRPEVVDPLSKLLNDENIDLIDNFEVFECEICYSDVEIGSGAIIRNCTHKFCKDCLVESIKHSEDFEVKCPADGCKFTLQEREVRKLSPSEIFEKHLEKSLKLYQSVSDTAVHCKTPDCPGWIEADKNVRGFTCPACSKVNCIGCKTIHQGKNCQEYQDEVNPDGKHKRENEESEQTIKSMIANNEAMYCPQCGIPVMKVDGCDYITCGTCKLGICWVTKKPRRPITKSDGTVIDGCHCREYGGKLCHPSCRHCH